MRITPGIVTLVALFLAGVVSARGQATSDIALVIRNNGTGVNAGQDTLRFGVNPSGTNGRDASLGEDEQPPAPPSAVFDIRWVNVGTSNNFGEGVKKNYRASTSSTQSDTFRIRLQAGDGGFPVVISWPASLSSNFGTAQLRYFDNNAGANVNVNMLTSSTTSISDDQVSTVTIYTTNPSGAAAALSVSPSPLNFGAVALPLPGTKTDSLTIRNNGATAASVTGVTSSNAAFVVATPPNFPLSIAAGGSVRVGIIFTAPGPGAHSSTITVAHNQPGSPTSVTATASAGSGEGLFLLNNLNTIFDNQSGRHRQVVGLKYNGSVGAQGIQFKITAPTSALKITSVRLGSSVPNPGNWSFDHNIVLAASGSEAQVLLFGRDSTVNFPAGTYDSLVVVRFDVKNVNFCNGGAGGDTILGWMYLNDVQSSLANNLGTSAGITADAERDSSQFNIHNSSARGDVNCDDHVDILDLLDIIDVIVLRRKFEPWQKNRADLAPWNPGWASGLLFKDAVNFGDNNVNVQDATLLSNAILNEEWPDHAVLYRAGEDEPGGGASALIESASAASTSAGAAIFDVKLSIYVSASGVTVTMNNLVAVKGIQLKLKASAPSDMTPRLLSSLADKFTVQHNIVDGEIRLLIYSLGGDAIAPSNSPLLELPFAITDLSSVTVVEPITIGGSRNERLLVEYELIKTVLGVDDQNDPDEMNLTAAPEPGGRTWGAQSQPSGIEPR